MIKYSIIVFSILCFLGFGSKAYSSLFENVFSGAREVYTQSTEESKYPVALGSLKRVNGVIMTEKEITVSGALTKSTFEMPSPFSPETALSVIEGEVKKYDSRLLFACDGLECGSSNAWANNRFGVKLIYGNDQSQMYRVWEVTLSQSTYLVKSYTVRRGNRKVYTHIETILLADKAETVNVLASPKAILSSLKDDGFYELSGFSYSKEALLFDQAYLKNLIDALQLEPFLSFAVVGHDYSRGKEAFRQEQSLTYAKKLIDQLEQLGVRSARMNPYGIGGLAPSSSQASRRLVLVRR